MRSFSEENYRNIQSLFTEKTGVPLRKRRAARAAPVALAAAVLAALLTVTALAADLFSPLAGDDLALGAVYEGDGVVSVHVENRSDKELKFQKQLRLLRWDTSEEIAPKRGAAVRFANTAFAPHTEGVMTLDLSRAYDLEALDEPLAQGGYYLVLTNSNFVFGQDWICFIHAAAPEETGALTRLFASARFTVSMRLHALTLSCLALTPAFGVDGDGRIAAFAKECGLPYRAAAETGDMTAALEAALGAGMPDAAPRNERLAAGRAALTRALRAPGKEKNV